MASIYDIKGWDTNGTTPYVVDNIVTHNSLFYYCIQAHNTKHEPSSSSAYWDGTIEVDTVEDSHFIWIPSYSYNVQHKPNVISIQFGNGYEQRLQDGINNNLITLELKFEARSSAETTAIVHFLTDKAGYRGFWFKTPAPFNVIKKFACRNWTTNQVFDENFSVSASFTEIP